MAFQLLIITKAKFANQQTSVVSVASSIASFDTQAEADTVADKLFSKSHEDGLKEFAVQQHVTKLY